VDEEEEVGGEVEVEGDVLTEDEADGLLVEVVGGVDEDEEEDDEDVVGRLVVVVVCEADNAR
jgi:hypothetical protein